MESKRRPQSWRSNDGYALRVFRSTTTNIVSHGRARISRSPMRFLCNEPAPEPIENKIRFCVLDVGHVVVHEVGYPESPLSSWSVFRWTSDQLESGLSGYQTS